MDPFIWDQVPAEEGGKEVPQVTKGDEEIAKFTVDEHLSEVEKCVLFLNGGQPIQQKYAIVNLPNLLKGRGRPAFDSVINPLKNALSKLDPDAQITTAEAFATIAKERALTPSDLSQCILPLVLKNLTREKNEEETDAWLKALYELVPLLDKQVLRAEVLSLAMSKGDSDGDVTARVTCCKILGAVSPHLNREEIERTFFKRAMAMCQDTDYQVRITMCQQLNAIARTVGKDLTRQVVLEELLELVNDEEVQVRVCAFTSLVSVIDVLPSDAKKTVAMPVLRRHMQPLELDMVMQKCIAKLFGQILFAVKNEFDEEDNNTFYGCYKHLATRQDNELRLLCAQQFPAILKVACTTCPGTYTSVLHDAFCTLASDSDEEVRRTIAAQFHEVARMFGKEYCARMLTKPLVALMKDELQSVQAELLPMLSTTLQYFACSDEALSQAVYIELAQALLELDNGVNHAWRMQLNLCTAFTSFNQFYSSDQIYEYFLPLSYKYTTNGAMSVRNAAAESIVCFWRCMKKEKHRAEIFLRVIKDYAHAKPYWQRLVFADICQHTVRKFSTKFFKEYIFDLCLELLHDPVPNVKVHVVSLLPSLKQIIKLPEDVEQLERLNNAMSNLMTDNDRDVSLAARAVHESFKRTPVRMAGGAGVIDMNGLAGGQGNFESEDKRKEEEELEFTFLPEDLERIRAEIVQLGVKGKKGGKAPAEAAAASDSAAVNTRKPGVAARTSAPSTGSGRGSMFPSMASMNKARGSNASDDGSFGVSTKSLGGSSFLGVSSKSGDNGRTAARPGVAASSANVARPGKLTAPESPKSTISGATRASVSGSVSTAAKTSSGSTPVKLPLLNTAKSGTSSAAGAAKSTSSTAKPAAKPATSSVLTRRK